VSTRTRRLLIAAVWSCTAAVCVLIALFPAFARFMALESWPLGIAGGAVIGWQAHARRNS
jgi:hypothetical protein